MYIARMGQLMRTDTSLLYGLRDEGIDPGELCITQLDIYPPRMLMASATAFQLNVAYWVMLRPGSYSAP